VCACACARMCVCALSNTCRSDEFAISCEQKFCSTFIRPTMLPLLNTYSLEKCASFVADSVEYLPLDDAYRLVSS